MDMFLEKPPEVKASMSVILLVEDFEPMRTSTALVLRQMGHRVVEAGHAEAAMRLLEKEHFDFLFTDIALPGTSGEALAVEACTLRPQLRVVFSTGLVRFPPSEPAGGRPILREQYTLDRFGAAPGGESTDA